MNKLSFFITSNDTDVGKTFITSTLLYKFNSLGYKTRAIKPIETGFKQSKVINPNSDIAKYTQICKTNSFTPRYSFSFPASPHYSANLEDKRANLDEIYKYCKEHIRKSEVTLIEGAGGIMVPINENESFLDLVKMLDIPLILVISNRLGGINNALINLEVLQNHGIKIAAVVMNFSDRNDAIKSSNIQFIKSKFGGVVVSVDEFKELNYLDACKEASTKFDEFFSNLDSFKPKKFDYEFEKNHIWHPYTSALKPIKALKVHFAKDKFIYTDRGRLLEAMGSWWCVNNGYNKDSLNKAAISQINKFSHIMFGGLTHEPALNLAKRLIEILPCGLEHIFYSDSGSVSVEVAIKMALQYQQSKNPLKTKILTPYGGYHGDTFGAMSVCDPINGMHSLFSKTLAKQIFFNRPKCGYFDKFNKEDLKDFENKISLYKDEIAAVILEPIIQGAGGMWFYHKEYLKAIKEICKKEDILLIFDEIATGFGRTGELFASNLANVTPDIICIGKAMTGGFMSFAATITNEKVAKGISKNGGVFMHGPTFMANPLACEVALKNIENLLKSDYKNSVKNIENWLNKELLPCKEFDAVKDVRALGAIGVVELKCNVNLEKITDFFVQNGLWLRPFGRLIYTMPHFNFTKDDIKFISNLIFKAIKEEKFR